MQEDKLLDCLPTNREHRARASKLLDKERGQLTDRANRDYWRGRGAVNFTNDPKFLETYDPQRRHPYRAIAGYVTHFVDLYIAATSTVLAYGRMRPYEPDQKPRYASKYKESIGVWEGAQHGGQPTFHDVPAQSYVNIEPKNVWSDEVALPTDAVELGNLLTSPTFEELLQDARNELDIRRQNDVWALLNAGATAGFGANLVRQVHPNVAATRLIAGNDFNWTAGQANPSGVGNFAAGFTLPKFEEMINLTAGMLGRDGRPLQIKRIIVPNGAQVRRDVMAWPGPTATGGGLPEGIKEEIWRGTWLFQPRNMETGELLVNAVMEEDATIGDDYIYLFTNEPAFEFAYWPGSYREWTQEPNYDDPDHFKFKIRDKYREYLPVPYLWHWLRIRIW